MEACKVCSAVANVDELAGKNGDEHASCSHSAEWIHCSGHDEVRMRLFDFDKEIVPSFVAVVAMMALEVGLVGHIFVSLESSRIPLIFFDLLLVLGPK